MKNRIATIFVLVVFTAGTVQVEAQVTSGNPQDSPYITKNSPYSIENSPYNPKNSEFTLITPDSVITSYGTVKRANPLDTLCVRMMAV